LVDAHDVTHAHLRVRLLRCLGGQVGQQALIVEVMAALAQCHTGLLFMIYHAFQPEFADDQIYLSLPPRVWSSILLLHWTFCFLFFFNHNLSHRGRSLIIQTLLLAFVGLPVAMIEKLT
jgi:hypothetical protein